MKNGQTLVFAPIAERETLFYIALGKEIQKEHPGTAVQFVSFFQPGNQLIRDAGFGCFDIYAEQSADDERHDEVQVASLFGIDSIRKLTFHEKITFNIADDITLVQKFKRYLFACDRILEKIAASADHVTVYQELGGFVAPLSLYFAARKRDIDHVFFEPSFFRGRIYFVKNSLNAPRVPHEVERGNENEPIVARYLKEVLAKKAAVIPSKDAHHFMDMGLKKLANASNLKKITKKITYKYLHGYKQEYEHILNHSVRSFGMLLNRKICADLYQPLPVDSGARNFIYFPFHVRLDYALTTRSPQYFDQIALVRQVAEILPEGFELYVKEHPASVGSFSRQEILPMLTNKKIRMLHPRTSTYDVLDQARAVLTINSKVGAEAVAAGKPVIVLGECFYSGSSLVHPASGPAEVQKLLELLAEGKLTAPTESERVAFFTKVWNQTTPGELYDLSVDSVRLFTDQIRKDANIGN